MPNIVITTRPKTEKSEGYLLIEADDSPLTQYKLQKGLPITLKIDKSSGKYCTGWYDISTHTNYSCKQKNQVNGKYESCFECRTKTAFNPAFYNTSQISDVQAEYNNTPHTVYVAYFGNGIAKAGIMADSRGFDRIYEQGALFYAIIDNFEDATKAHNLESRLIDKGLKNSVTKQQKQKAFSSRIDAKAECIIFRKILDEIGLSNNVVVNNLDHFYYGKYIPEPVVPLTDEPISGTIRALVGRYLVLENDNRLYGYWLSKLSGYVVDISNEVITIDSSPHQTSLF
jgi:hypothetical protein